MRRRNIWSAVLAVAVVGGLGAGVVTEQASASVSKTRFTTTNEDCLGGHVKITTDFTGVQFVGERLKKHIKGTEATAAGWFVVSGPGLEGRQVTVTVDGTPTVTVLYGSTVFYLPGAERTSPPTWLPSVSGPSVYGMVADTDKGNAIKVRVMGPLAGCTVRLAWTRTLHGDYVDVAAGRGVSGRPAQFWANPTR